MAEPSPEQGARGKRQALEGLRVLDMGHIVSAGICTSLMADFGAEVTKLERPQVGDGMRELGPTKKGHTLWWKVNARNKKSITLNLAVEEGKRLCLDLVRRSDIVVENFRPGTLERLGLGWDVMSAINPGLIMLRISGYGQTGRHADRRGFGRAAEAMSGAVYLTGFPDGPPMHPGFSMGDVTTGLMGAYAAMVAVHNRDHHGGRGQQIDLALYESLFRLIDWQVIIYDQLGVVPERVGSRFPFNMAGTANLYKTLDQHWIAVSAATQITAERVLRVVGGEALCSDPRFRTTESRYAHADELDILIGKWFSEHNRDDILAKFQEGRAIASSLYNVKDMLADPHFAERGNVIEVEDPHLGRVKMAGIIPTFSDTPGKVERTGPTLGQDNDEVFLKRLEIPADEYADLKARGVI